MEPHELDDIQLHRLVQYYDKILTAWLEDDERLIMTRFTYSLASAILHRVPEERMHRYQAVFEKEKQCDHIQKLDSVPPTACKLLINLMSIKPSMFNDAPMILGNNLCPEIYPDGNTTHPNSVSRGNVLQFRNRNSK